MARSLDLIGPDESADLRQLLERFHPARLPRRPWVVGPDAVTAPAKVARDHLGGRRSDRRAGLVARGRRVVGPAGRSSRRPAVTRALAYTALMATPEVGDRVLLNVAALDRGLGTGVTHW